MADTTASTALRLVPAPVTTTEVVVEHPFTVCIRPHGCDFAEYQGSRAQLEAEGVIPAGTEWPEGQQSVSWEQGLLSFSLKRTRPEGMKGPMKLWIAGDYWNLRWERKVMPGRAARAIAEKSMELAKVIYDESPEGRRAYSARFELYWAAYKDKAFQAFKNTIIPERKKPGRPAKSNTPEQSQGASK